MSIVKSVVANVTTPVGCASIAQAQTNKPPHSGGLGGDWLPLASEYSNSHHAAWSVRHVITEINRSGRVTFVCRYEIGSVGY